MASFQITNSIGINRSAEAVFQYATKITEAPSWRPNLTVKDFSGDPLEIGSTWNDVTKFMGRDMVVKHKVTALEQGRRYEVKQDGGGASGIMTMSFSPDTDDSSTVTLSFDGEISGWLAGLAAGLLRSQAEKSMKRDLANLKSNLESS